MKEAFYKSAIRQAPVGYACHELIYDENGNPCDFEYVEINPTFARCLGKKEEDFCGKKFSEIYPGYDQEKMRWIDLFNDVKDQGEPQHIDKYFETLRRWYRIMAFSPEKDIIISYILDFTEEYDNARELISVTTAFEETSRRYKSIAKEKTNWERRLNDIAELLKQENEKQFQRIIENLPMSLYITSMEGVLLYANAKCLKLFGLKPEDIGKKQMTAHWENEEERRDWLTLLKEQGFINDYELRLKSASDKKIWAITSGIIIQYKNKASILSTHLDIKERKRIESELKASEEKYRLLTEFSSDVIWILNLNQKKLTYVSPSSYYLTGFTPDEMMDLGPDSIVTEESLTTVKTWIERNMSEFLSQPDSPKSYMTEVRQKCKSGDVIWVEISAKFRFNNAKEIEIVAASRNIEERKKAEREVVYLSYHDQLTGLYNRRFYEEELSRINYKWNLPITLVLADVNGLKLTNDAFGHNAGDELLKRLSFIFKSVLRAEDVAARIGGDEFAVLLSRAGASEAERVIRKIKNLMKSSRSGQPILSVSFGWATKVSLEEDFYDLFLQAEDNMYHNKLIESPRMKNDTIQLAMRQLFQRNAMERQHAERVGSLCKRIGHALRLGDRALYELELLGRMHDIGKIGISEEILNESRKLNETEWLEIKRHPEIGYQILRSADEYVHIAESVLSHHERIDGKGYPRNLRASDIPLYARILSVAEAYDSMMNQQNHRHSMSEGEVISELYRKSGTQFDGEIVKVFVEESLQH
jgi:diguanylate cyclase (GGDEF)-like protein/PAS domain S-box-containing protein